MKPSISTDAAVEQEPAQLDLAALAEPEGCEESYDEEDQTEDENLDDGSDEDYL